jgi:hypothetical protein
MRDARGEFSQRSHFFGLNKLGLGAGELIQRRLYFFLLLF